MNSLRTREKIQLTFLEVYGLLCLSMSIVGASTYLIWLVLVSL